MPGLGPLDPLLEQIAKAHFPTQHLTYPLGRFELSESRGKSEVSPINALLDLLTLTNKDIAHPLAANAYASGQDFLHRQGHESGPFSGVTNPLLDALRASNQAQERIPLYGDAHKLASSLLWAGPGVGSTAVKALRGGLADAPKRWTDLTNENSDRYEKEAPWAERMALESAFDPMTWLTGGRGTAMEGLGSRMAEGLTAGRLAAPLVKGLGRGFDLYATAPAHISKFLSGSAERVFQSTPQELSKTLLQDVLPDKAIEVLKGKEQGVEAEAKPAAHEIDHEAAVVLPRVKSLLGKAEEAPKEAEDAVDRLFSNLHHPKTNPGEIGSEEYRKQLTQNLKKRSIRAAN